MVDVSVFVLASYGITFLIVGGLVVQSLVAARRVRRQRKNTGSQS
ncbi:MAG: heme exporter protein CcmD [Alphaproteobacteria bacterium]|nr:heme exporter protein CcmD [Alphaproteobacteria bacterium]